MAQQKEPRTKAGPYYLSSTIIKAFRVIEAIAEHQPVPAAEIQRVAGISKGTVHNHLATLEHLDIIQKSPDGYSLTFKMYALGNTVPISRDVAAIARPFMKRLAEEYGITAYLLVPGDLQMVNVERIRPRTDIQISDDFAITYELHCTASGKLYLSTMEEDERFAAYNRMSFAALTPQTVTDRSVLEEQIVAAQKAGYATDHMEHGPNITSVAAPVFDHRGVFVASLAIAGPTVLLPDSQKERITPRIVSDAQEISRRMGYPAAGEQTTI